jgi:ElaB/YqjD/DUF883 family membrane-anchored ribosome-binding protein
MTPDPISHEDTRSSAEIEADIRHTRGRMDATLEELGERLTARSLLNSALDWWEAPPQGAPRGSLAAKRAAGTVGRTLKDHPLPTILIGAGIALLIREASAPEYDEAEEASITRYRTRPQRGGPLWSETETGMAAEGPLIEGDFEDEGPGMGERAKDTIAGAKEKLSGAKKRASGATERAKDRMHGAADRLGEWGHERSRLLGRSTRRTLSRGKSASRRAAREIEEGYHAGVDKIDEAMDEYPLAVGIGFAALGMLAGLLLPRTRREDEMLGERSDEFIDAAKEKGEDLLERGKAVGGRVAEAAMEEAREQGLTAEAAKEQLAGLAGKVSDVAQRAKEEAALAAEDQHLTPEALKQEAVEESTGKQPGTTWPTRPGGT